MNKQRGINFLKAVSFLLIVVLTLVFLGPYLTPKDNTKEAGAYPLTNHLNAGGIYAEPEDTIDVLFLGDSESYAAFNPLQLYKDTGWTSYNLGTGAQEPYETLHYLESALKIQSPKVVVIETNCFFRGVSPEDMMDDTLTQFFPALKYHDRWKNLTARDLDTKIDHTQLSDWKGFMYDDTSVDPEHYEAKENVVAYQYIPALTQVYVKQLFSLCEEQGIQVVLAMAPSLQNWTETRHDVSEALAEEYDTLFLDLNQETGVSEKLIINWDKDSKDGGDHLNASGAVKATRRMEQFLSENVTLEDHRGQAAYEAWDALVEQYSRKLK